MEDYTSTLSTWAGNLKRNTSKAFEDLQPQTKIRLVVAVCAYLLLRPYLVRLGSWLQMRDLEKQNEQSKRDAAAATAAGDAQNARIAIPGVELEDEERDEMEVQESASHWGRRAKIRQRAMFRQKLEELEAKLRDAQDDSDADIADLLED